MLDDRSPGPDREKIIRAALRDRLLRDHVLDPAKIDAMLAVAAQNVRVRMMSNGWGVTESDAVRFTTEARSRPGWLRQVPSSESASNESAFDRLKRANREVQSEQPPTTAHAEESEACPQESAMERLKRANRESRPLRENTDGSWSFHD